LHSLGRTQEDEVRPSLSLLDKKDAIRTVVEAHRASNPRIFGSAASGSDSVGSDLDILIDPGPFMTLLDVGAIRYELRELLGVDVDVFTPGALPATFRSKVLAEAVQI
jgi:predicted nucleotidyltransferase